MANILNKSFEFDKGSVFYRAIDLRKDRTQIMKYFQRSEEQCYGHAPLKSRAPVLPSERPKNVI